MKKRVKSFRGEGHDVGCRWRSMLSRTRCRLVKLAMMLHKLDVSSYPCRAEQKTPRNVFLSSSRIN